MKLNAFRSSTRLGLNTLKRQDKIGVELCVWSINTLTGVYSVLRPFCVGWVHIEEEIGAYATRIPNIAPGWQCIPVGCNHSTAMMSAVLSIVIRRLTEYWAKTLLSVFTYSKFPPTIIGEYWILWRHLPKKIMHDVLCIRENTCPGCQCLVEI